ncbi:transposase, partial [Pseudomonas sp. 2995-1]
MNYNRNQKISQIDENTLIVGIDIAKKTNYARAQDFRGIDFSKALKFDNKFEGFEALCQWILDLQLQHSKSKLIVGME